MSSLLSRILRRSFLVSQPPNLSNAVWNLAALTQIKIRQEQARTKATHYGSIFGVTQSQSARQHQLRELNLPAVVANGPCFFQFI
jgi:hypothetical protein